MMRAEEWIRAASTEEREAMFRMLSRIGYRYVEDGEPPSISGDVDDVIAAMVCDVLDRMLWVRAWLAAHQHRRPIAYFRRHQTWLDLIDRVVAFHDKLPGERLGIGERRFRSNADLMRALRDNMRDTQEMKQAFADITGEDTP